MPYLNYGWLFVPQWSKTGWIEMASIPASLVTLMRRSGPKLLLHCGGMQTITTGLFVAGETQANGYTPALPVSVVIARYLQEVHLPPLLSQGTVGPAHQETFNLTIEDAAERLGVTPRAVQLAVQAGRLRGQKVANKWWLSETSVANYKPSGR